MLCLDATCRLGHTVVEAQACLYTAVQDVLLLIKIQLSPRKKICPPLSKVKLQWDMCFFFLSESAKKLRVVSFAKPFQLFNLRMCRRFSARLPLPQDSPLIATILENHEMFEIIDSSQFNLLWNKFFIFPTLLENQSLYSQKFSKKCCISGRILKRYLKRG